MLRTALHSIWHTHQTPSQLLRTSLILAQAEAASETAPTTQQLPTPVFGARARSMQVVVVADMIASMLCGHSLFALVIAAHGQNHMATGLSNLQARLVADA